METLVESHLSLPPVRIPTASPLRRGAAPPPFTAEDMAAAELLVQLSGSGSGSVSGGGGGASNELPADDSSPRSVNTLLAIAFEVEFADDGEEMGGPRRRNPRYRLIADLLAATEPIDGSSEKRAKTPQKKRRVAVIEEDDEE